MVGGILWQSWPGLGAAVVARVLFLHVFCLLHRAMRGKSRPSPTPGPAARSGNQLCLLLSAILVLGRSGDGTAAVSTHCSP
jgi:hypothetical protein